METESSLTSSEKTESSASRERIVTRFIFKGHLAKLIFVFLVRLCCGKSNLVVIMSRDSFSRCEKLGDAQYSQNSLSRKTCDNLRQKSGAELRHGIVIGKSCWNELAIFHLYGWDLSGFVVGSTEGFYNNLDVWSLFCQRQALKSTLCRGILWRLRGSLGSNES